MEEKSKCFLEIKLKGLFIIICVIVLTLVTIVQFEHGSKLFLLDKR